MGYFFISEAENAVPASILATPKTHTPLSQVQERGLRFYNPGLGRWVNRDPLGEAGGMGLYGFVQSNPIRNLDSVGEQTNDPQKPACACKCKSVAIQFHPGGTNFAWKVYKDPDGMWKLGNEISVDWDVDGNTNACKYEQNEIGFLSVAYPSDNDESSKWLPVTPYRGDNVVAQHYVDSLGVILGLQKRIAAKAGYINITFLCTSADGTQVKELRI